MRDNLFLKLPPPVALLLLSSVVNMAAAHALPRATTTIPYTIIDVVPWPLQPTAAPFSPVDLADLRIRQVGNTVCGYIGGDPNLPATCSPGSHCVLAAEQNVIGCCPDGAATCSTGVFTGCVDSNSGPQTEVNPYVFTCQGGDVCYQNQFAGGFSQFGCGTASNLATTVKAAPSGPTNLDVSLTSESVSLTEPTTTLATPTSIGTGTRSSTKSKTTTSTPSSSKSSSSTSHTSPSASPSTAAASAANPGNASVQQGDSSSPSFDKTGAIIGGTISGVAVLVAIVALVFYLYKRRGNVRTGPGRGGTEYIRYVMAVYCFPPKLGSC